MSATPAAICLDCSAVLPRRESGKGAHKLRCGPCARRAMHSADRKCKRCRSRKAVFRLSHCEPCRALRQPVGAIYTRTCRCGVVFVAANPLKVNCSASCRRRNRSPHKLTTRERGYGSAHQKRRRELLDGAIGTDCELCGQRMSSVDKLDADHVIPISQGGVNGPLRIVHAVCNRGRARIEVAA